MKKFIFFLAFLICTTPALAEHRILLFSDDLRSSASFSVNGDNADGVGSDLSGVIYLRKNINLQVAAGNSKSKTSSDEGTFKYTSFGVGSDPTKMFAANINAEATNLDDYIRSVGITAPLYLTLKDFEIGLTPGVRAHAIQTENTNDDDIGFQENSFAVSLGYYGWDPFSLRIFGAKHEYTKEVENFSATVAKFPAVLDLLKSSTLSMLTSLIKTRGGLQLGYVWRDFYFSFESYRIVSALDESETQTNIIGVDYDITESWQFNFSTGSAGLPDSADPETERVTFTSLGVTYSWLWN